MSSAEYSYPNHSTTIQTLPFGSPTPAADTNSQINAKRLLFGRKKKSASVLTGSPSTNTLNTASSSQLSNDSVESLNGAEVSDDGAGAQKKKGAVMSVFKRKSKIDNPSANSSIGSIDETPAHKGAGENLYEDEASSLHSDESDPQTTSNMRPKSSGLLTSTPTSNRPNLFGRRSTSPRASAPAATMGKSQSKENAKASSPSEARPATSAGEARPSQDRSRRAGRVSVGTSDASDLPPPIPVLRHATDDARKKASINFPLVTIQDADAPEITILAPTPTDPVGHFPLKSPVGVVVNGLNGRRSRTNSLSNAPSKLSQSISATGGRGSEGISSQEGSNNTGGGFFQTMFSAAQNAATSLTNNIPLNLTNNPNNQPRSSTVDPVDKGMDSGGLIPGVDGKQEREREPAIKTLGKGELNLATLGIVPDPVSTTQTDGSNAVYGGGGAGSRGNGGDAVGDDAERTPLSGTTMHSGFEMAGEISMTHRTPYAEDISFSGNRGGSSVGDLTPDRNSIIGDDQGGMEGDMEGSGSIRSMGAAIVKRHRGSSATSQGNFLLPIPKPTGFAVASKKRNRDFHNLFKSVPEEDYLIEDYGCALQKEILLQGRLYVSEGHICFYSNILGWITTLVISFDEVMSVEKKSTALLFPNAIVIQTLHARHIFASFISRDSTYDLILGLWNVGHPQIVAGNGEAHLDGSPEDGESGNEDDDEYEDETEDDLGGSFMDAGDGPFEDDDNNALTSALKGPSRRTSQVPLGGSSSGGVAGGGAEGASGDFPGPKIHAPTACGDDDMHYDKILCDEILPAPMGKVYSLLFGPQSYPFVTNLLSEEEKVLELDIPNNGEWFDQDGKKTRTFSYVKPLSGGIGPSKTRCNITETIDFLELEDHVTVTVSTQTPDVPSGGVFSVKTRYCLMWGEGGGTRMISNCTVEWTGKSWIKGPIEKGASDGQVAYNKSLLFCLRREIAPKRAPVLGKGPTGKSKGRRRKDAGLAGGSVRAAAAAANAAAAPGTGSWGLFEPFKPYFGPIADIFGPLLPANFGFMIMAVLITWFVASRFRPAPVPTAAVRGGGPIIENHWEDMWRGEEEGLWDWLEDRVGLDGIPSLQQKEREGRQNTFEKNFNARTAGTALKDRQVNEAIAVMEERLDTLKRIVKKRKGDTSTAT